MSQQATKSDAPTISKRLIRGALWPLFVLVLLLPKFLALRRRAGSWNVLRVIAALAGVALIAEALTHRVSVWTAAFGVLLLLLALLVTPERRQQTLDEKSRELGALITVNGGEYRPAQGSPVKIHLCVGAECLWLLDERLQVVLEIPLASLSVVQVQPAKDGWKLSCIPSNPSPSNPHVDLAYEGPFAEHFARVAESTVRSQLRRELPILR